MSRLLVAACRDDRLIARITAEIDAVADEVLASIVAEIPYYRTLEPEQFDSIRQIAVGGMGACLTLWQEGRLPRPEELSAFRAHGADRAAEGRPLTVVLRAYRLTGRVALDYLIRNHGASLDVPELANFAQLVMGFIDQISDVVTEGYVEATEHLAAGRARAARELFEDLLTGRFVSNDSIRGRARVLAVRLPNEPRVLVARPGSTRDPSLTSGEARLQASLAASGRSALTLLTRRRLVALVEAGGDELEHHLAQAGLRGVAIHAASIADVPDAFRRALAAADLIEGARIRARTLITGPEADLLLHLAGTRSTADPYGPVLGDLLDPRHAHLIDTLQAFFDTGNAVTTAQHLGTHPQTVRHRLRRVREISGRDAYSGWDRFILETALRGSTLRAVSQRHGAGS